MAPICSMQVATSWTGGVNQAAEGVIAKWVGAANLAVHQIHHASAFAARQARSLA